MVPPIACFACLALVVVAMLSDWLTRRIPNLFSLGGIATGIVLHSIVGYAASGGFGMLRGAGFALLGAVMCGALPAVQFARGHMGGGDVKLLAAVGALMGPFIGFDAVAATFAIVFVIVWPYRLIRAGWRGKATKVAPVILGPSICAGVVLAMLRHGAFS